MEAKTYESENEAVPMDSDHPAGFDELKLEDLIGKRSLDFEEWISLISRIEKIYTDDIERICLVYDSFLSEFPLCHGYWRRYADHKIRLSSVGEVVEVFERAVRSATYSVCVWVDYCTFSMLVFEDPDDVRRLFRRGLSYVGRDHLCHELWDQYIKFELSQEQWSLLAQIYIEALRFPTKKLHLYYDGFQKLAALCNKELGCESNHSADSLLGSLIDYEVPKSYSGHDISSVVKDLFEPSISFARSKTLLQKYLYIGEHLYNEASQMDERISSFEANIRRSYFHVKPLDVDQLENWHHYLDFVEMQEDFDWVVKLYERCLIPCADYPEFWMRYVEFMETKGGREIANYALNRATKVFLKRTPVIHLFNARFKEHQGDVIGAHSALLHCDAESGSKFVENVVIKANMERRLGNFVAASKIFEDALAMAKAKDKLHTLPSLYVHFSRLKRMTTDSSDAARDVLIDGIKHLPNSKLLLEELINFVTLNGGQRHLQAVDSIIDSVVSPGPDVTLRLNNEDAEDVSSLYLKFVDLCGTIHEVRKAWNRHIRQFPHSIRTSLNEQLTANEKSLESAEGGTEAMVTEAYKARRHIRQFPHSIQTSLNEQLTTNEKSLESAEGGTEAMVTKPQQPSENCSPDYLIQLPLQDEKIFTHDSSMIDSNSGHNFTQCISRDNPDITYEQVHTKSEEACHSRESDHSAMEIAALPSIEVHEQSRNASAETNEPSVGLGSSKVSEQPGEDTAECQVAEGTKSEQATKGHSNANDSQNDYDHEPQQNMKSLPLDGLPLHSQDNSSHALNSSIPFPSEAPPETCNLGGSNIETDQQNKEESPISSQGKINAFDSLQTEIEVVNLSSSGSHPSPISTEQLPHPHMRTNSNTVNHQVNDPSRLRRESKFGPRGPLDRKSNQQQQVSSQHRQVELGGIMPMNQGYAPRIASPHSPQVQHGSRAQQQYQAATPTNSTTPLLNTFWPLQNTQQPNGASLHQPTQGSGEHGMQNNQSYNQMWQYYYNQQQLLMQQQQQPPHQQQHHLQPSQQYQHQQPLPSQQQNFQPPPYQQPQLQQQQYNQQQQQQFPFPQHFYQQTHHQQQFYQPPPQHQFQQQPSQHQQQLQLFVQPVIQQSSQEQQVAEQRQYQQQNNRSQIQETGHNHFQQNASLDRNVANQSAPEPAPHVMASQDQVSTLTPMSQKQSPGK